MPCSSPIVERLKPLLGTFVRIRVSGLAPRSACELLNAVFAEMTAIHRLMSFQEPGSDITRLNRSAHLQPIPVDVRTYEVLRHANDMAARSDGVFDVTVAPYVERGLQETPCGAPLPDPCARWSDVKLLPGQYVSFMRPLWIDVSGIAKGYAVDRAIELLSNAKPEQVCVNAGGDLCVRGARAEEIWLDADSATEALLPMVALRDGSLASSAQSSKNVHIDARTRRRSRLRFASVLAPTCVVADALTKVVLALGPASAQILRHFAARSIVSDGEHWREVA